MSENNNSEGKQSTTNNVSATSAKFPNKFTTDNITLNDYYSSLQYSEKNLNDEQKDIYKTFEAMNYCFQNASIITGDNQLGQTGYIEQLCSFYLLKGSKCLQKYVSFNSEESPLRKESQDAFNQFYFNLMHCKEDDPETNKNFKDFVLERNKKLGSTSFPVKQIFPNASSFLKKQNLGFMKQVFENVESQSINDANKTSLLVSEITKNVAQQQYEDLKTCAKDRFFKKDNQNKFSMNTINTKSLSSRCFIPYMEYMTRLGSIMCRSQIEQCLRQSTDNTDIESTNSYILYSCLSEDTKVANCMRFIEKNVVDNLQD
ncbi:hypothetical protein ABK040_011507 [Willaertia magna]